MDKEIESSSTSLSSKIFSQYTEKDGGRYKPELELLSEIGRLSMKFPDVDKEGKPDYWDNVIEHSLVQAAVVDVISELIGLSKEETDALRKVALCHDWDKRLQIKSDDFSGDYLKAAQTFLEVVDPDEDLMEATGPEFLEKALIKKEASFLEDLQFYIDDITKGSEIVPFDERIDEVSERRQDLNDDDELTAKLGGKYWDKERELGHKVEKEIFDILKEKGIEIERKEDIPLIIRDRINEKFA